MKHEADYYAETMPAKIRAVSATEALVSACTASGIWVKQVRSAYLNEQAGELHPDVDAVQHVCLK